MAVRKGGARVRQRRGVSATKAARATRVTTPRAPARTQRLPYLRAVGRDGAVSIWVVDGAYVRKNIDEEFSNFGHHFSCPEIPRSEIWLDQETDPDEQPFFLRHAILERRLMAAGKDYDTARLAACQAERVLRERSGDIRKVTRGKRLPDAARVHVRLWKALPSGVQVWIVNGRLVRSVFDVEFTEGGHEHVYEFVPHNEVWIDDDVEEDERGFVLFHELHERNLMAAGMDYDRAHADSSRLELRYRKHPDQLHEALAEEGWE
jgi:hypothetical protein